VEWDSPTETRYAIPEKKKIRRWEEECNSAKLYKPDRLPPQTFVNSGKGGIQPLPCKLMSPSLAKLLLPRKTISFTVLETKSKGLGAGNIYKTGGRK